MRDGSLGHKDGVVLRGELEPGLTVTSGWLDGHRVLTRPQHGLELAIAPSVQSDLACFCVAKFLASFLKMAVK